MVHSDVPSDDKRAREAGTFLVTAWSARPKRAHPVSILGAEKALGKWCIKDSFSPKQAQANSSASHTPPTARTGGGGIG